MSISNAKLDFWIKNHFNVLFTGRHGVGKTAIVKEAFERNNLHWKYFSAATMDPWVDFIGIPKEQKDENGEPYLDLVRPKDLRDDSIDAIFVDELNRSHKKVRNAVMELIQFKSINGRPFKNLKIVWAAVNPDDDTEVEYDVEKLDPAQADRFQIHITIPYKPDKPYFKRNFPEYADKAIAWWNQLSEKAQKEISPRRLDYALQVYQAKGDIRDVLPASANIGLLIQSLGQTSSSAVEPLAAMQEAYHEKNIEKAQAIVASMPTEVILPIVEKHKRLGTFFFPHLPEEIQEKLRVQWHAKNKIASVKFSKTVTK
ncbi:hypothetical protein HYS50_03445 [Candidatus Woesearchaeota archaeon]|nr:hypothetical protein [Candidatus Woesearchaeota archaeon]